MANENDNSSLDELLATLRDGNEADEHPMQEAAEEYEVEEEQKALNERDGWEEIIARREAANQQPELDREVQDSLAQREYEIQQGLETEAAEKAYWTEEQAKIEQARAEEIAEENRRSEPVEHPFTALHNEIQANNLDESGLLSEGLREMESLWGTQLELTVGDIEDILANGKIQAMVAEGRPYDAAYLTTNEIFDYDRSGKNSNTARESLTSRLENGRNLENTYSLPDGFSSPPAMRIHRDGQPIELAKAIQEAEAKEKAQSDLETYGTPPTHEAEEEEAIANYEIEKGLESEAAEEGYYAEIRATEAAEKIKKNAKEAEKAEKKNAKIRDIPLDDYKAIKKAFIKAGKEEQFAAIKDGYKEIVSKMEKVPTLSVSRATLIASATVLAAKGDGVDQSAALINDLLHKTEKKVPDSVYTDFSQALATVTNRISLDRGKIKFDREVQKAKTAGKTVEEIKPEQTVEPKTDKSEKEETAEAKTSKTEPKEKEPAKAKLGFWDKIKGRTEEQKAQLNRLDALKESGLDSKSPLNSDQKLVLADKVQKLRKEVKATTNLKSVTKSINTLEKDYKKLEKAALKPEDKDQESTKSKKAKKSKNAESRLAFKGKNTTAIGTVVIGTIAGLWASLTGSKKEPQIDEQGNEIPQKKNFFSVKRILGLAALAGTAVVAVNYSQGKSWAGKILDERANNQNKGNQLGG